MKEHPYMPKTRQAFVISIFLRHVDVAGKPIFTREQLSTLSLATLQALYLDLKPSQTQQERYEKRGAIREHIKKKTPQRD